jgi:two-component system, response regulator, stage 0 sporulation protein F
MECSSIGTQLLSALDDAFLRNTGHTLTPPVLASVPQIAVCLLQYSSYPAPIDRPTAVAAQEIVLYLAHGARSFRRSLTTRRRPMPTQAPQGSLIALVEDSPEILDVLKRRFAKLAPLHQLITAQTGGEALALVGGHSVTLAIVDYRLPGGMDGLSIVAALKAASPGVRTVLISASPTDALEAAALAAGVDVFLVKPFTLDELDQVVRTLLPGVAP